MKTVKRILLSFLKIVLVLVIIIFIARAINGYRYNKLREFNVEDIELFSGELNRKDPLLSDFSDIEINEIDGDYIYGYHLIPNNISHKGVVVTFGGSEGGSNIESATFIAKAGYEVLSLYFFGQENQQEELVNVPLEFFQEILDYIENSEVNEKTLTVLGGSKGAELALVLATIYPEIDNLILYAPSSHVFQGLSFRDREPHSSWSYKGEELDYLSFMDGDIKVPLKMVFNMIFNIPISHYDSYATLLKDKDKANKARIPIENFDGEILIFVGDDDKMWPSADMSLEIKEVLGDKVQLHIYEDVGHVFLGPPVLENLVMGGEYENNVNAKKDSNKVLIKTLNNWHK